jgi:hypothetical protein
MASSEISTTDKFFSDSCLSRYAKEIKIEKKPPTRSDLIADKNLYGHYKKIVV